MQAATPDTHTTPDGPAPWQAELARGYRDPAALLAALDLPATGLGILAHAPFPLRVPRGFVARMQPGDPRDPLLLQVLPLVAEGRPVPGFVSDPVGDLASARTPGLLQKYRGRALLVTTGACAVHCRYCFRRDYPYGEQSATAGNLDAALEAIAADPSLEEVILSGGDPLVLAEGRLEALLGQLDGMPHVQRIRLHSRVPVVLPERVDQRLLRLLQGLRKRLAIVIHANHANEIGPKAAEAIRALATAGPVLNQSVLLAGINDSPAAIADLSRALFNAGALPYYLHQLDPVAGASHFAVDDAAAVTLLAAVTRILPGYLVPKLVREVPGEPAKSALAPFGAT